MKISKHFMASLVLTVLVFIASLAQAQDNDSKSTTVGKTTVTVGSGMTFLSLPDTGSMITRGANNAATDFPIDRTYKFSDDFKEIGWNINTSFSVPLGGATLSLNSSWARIKEEDSFNANPLSASSGELLAVMPLVDDPNIMQTQGILGSYGGRLATDTDRLVDQWGIALEMQWGFDSPLDWTIAPNTLYLAGGLDVRGIYQDLDARIKSTTAVLPFVVNYNENLDTTYSGAYVAIGGKYSPFLVKSWGIEALFRLQGGAYYAYTDYDGDLDNDGPIISGGGDPSGDLSLSSDDAAFIGSLMIEISKRLGSFTTLSLNGSYEYYSYVPTMVYNTADRNSNPLTNGRQRGTFIDDDDAFSMKIGMNLAFEF